MDTRVLTPVMRLFLHSTYTHTCRSVSTALSSACALNLVIHLRFTFEHLSFMIECEWHGFTRFNSPNQPPTYAHCSVAHSFVYRYLADGTCFADHPSHVGCPPCTFTRINYPPCSNVFAALGYFVLLMLLFPSVVFLVLSSSSV